MIIIIKSENAKHIPQCQVQRASWSVQDLPQLCGWVADQLPQDYWASIRWVKGVVCGGEERLLGVHENQLLDSVWEPHKTRELQLLIPLL